MTLKSSLYQVELNMILEGIKFKVLEKMIVIRKTFDEMVQKIGLVDV